MIIGLDVGGTHTDVVLVGKKGLLKNVKVLTDTSDLFNTVLSGLTRITEGIEIGEIKRAVLSTTLTTNAVVQKKVPEVGMIISSGPGVDPESFRTGDHYHVVSGSIDHRGREIEGINAYRIEKIKADFITSGVKYVGVVGKFSTRNPAHERAMEKILGDDFSMVFLGHRLSGNLNFPRRIATTFLNASVYALHKKFFEAVQRSLNEKGLSIPIHILKADGGTMNFESSIDHPGQTILSGPAASTMGSIAHAPVEMDVISLDIGGTTTDISILAGASPLLEPVGIKRGKYRTLIRSLKSHSVGIGGDSLVSVADGVLSVGPMRKGPAMAYGGPAPTPTDALCVLGKVEDGDRPMAEKGIGTIADALGTSLADAAERIFDLTCDMILEEADKMVNKINGKPVYTVHELLEGYVVEPKKILVMGGPAAYFAERLNALSDLSVSAVPNCQVANAVGAALARTTCEVTLFADTERGFLTAPEEDYSEAIPRSYNRERTKIKATELLRSKALKRGAGSEDFEVEVVEDLEFNMIRGFSTTGKNIRVKVQVKPGLIHGYAPDA